MLCVEKNKKFQKKSVSSSKKRRLQHFHEVIAKRKEFNEMPPFVVVLAPCAYCVKFAVVEKCMPFS